MALLVNCSFTSSYRFFLLILDFCKTVYRFLHVIGVITCFKDCAAGFLLYFIELCGVEWSGCDIIPPPIMQRRPFPLFFFFFFLFAQMYLRWNSVYLYWFGEHFTCSDYFNKMGIYKSGLFYLIKSFI